MHKKTINKTAVDKASADPKSLLILVILKKSPNHLTETSCFLSPCFLGTLSFAFSRHGKKFQEKEVTLLLTGLWLDDENTPQGSRKLGLESPFCPWDSDTSHHSALQHQTPAGLAPAESPQHTPLEEWEKAKAQPPGLLVWHWYLQWNISWQMSKLAGTKWQPGRHLSYTSICKTLFKTDAIQIICLPRHLRKL